jgi:hypothetical protein
MPNADIIPRESADAGATQEWAPLDNPGALIRNIASSDVAEGCAKVAVR